MKLAFPTLVLLLVSSAWGPPTRAGEPDPNVLRLGSMNREERANLARKLSEFDALDRDQKSAIREMDAKIAELEPEVRNRYLSVLRRYHVFYQGLPAEKKKLLDATTDPAAKLELIEKLKAETPKPSATGRRLEDWVQVSTVARPPLRQTARELLVWFSLDAKEDALDREELRKARDPARRRAVIDRLGKKKRLGMEFKHEAAEFEADEAAVRAELLELEKGTPKSGGARPKADLSNRRDVIVRLAELKVIRDHDEQEVSPANLERFEAAMPPWAREGLDGLPPEAAKRRLTVLYRLVFPEGEEIPSPKPPNAPAPTAPARPAPPPAGASPF